MQDFSQQFNNTNNDKSENGKNPSKEQINLAINLAIKTHSEGNIQEAAKCYQYLIKQQIDDYRVFCNYGLILKDLKKPQEAELSLRKAISLNPNFAIAHINLGIVLKDLGKLQEAELSFRKAISLNANFEIAHLNLGIVLKDLGKLKEAEVSLCKAIKLNPDFAQAYSNLGIALRLSSRLKEAEIYLKKAIKLNPNYVEAYSNLGAVLFDQDDFTQASIVLHNAIKINPNFINSYFNLGLISRRLGDLEEAKKCYKECLRLDQSDLAFHIQSKLFVSYIIIDKNQIEIERNEINRQISLIGNRTDIFFKRNLISLDFIFCLNYHNYNDDKDILENISFNLSKKPGIINNSFDFKSMIKESLSRKKIKLGISSEFLYNHSVAKCYLELIKDFVNSGIEVVLFRSNNAKYDYVTKSLDSIVSETVILPESLETSCKIIIEKYLDILFYLDIGMDAKTYLMSLSRLALVQVVGGGHPSTSGSPNIDYFISSKYKETSDTDKYYSERLIRFNRLEVNYPQPEITRSTFKRSNLNTKDTDFLIGIQHSLYKFHPDFDYILDKILQEIPNALFIFSEGKKFHTETLKSRWKKNSNLILKRTIFYPRVEFEHFLELIKSCNIILDPFYSGMGNTFYQAMSFGIPVVTLPGIQQRGKVVYAGYKQMGIKNPPIANSPEEYISICKKLAFDCSYMEDIRKQILIKSKEKLFNDKTIYKEYIEFFYKSIDAARKKTLLPFQWMPSLDG